MIPAKFFFLLAPLFCLPALGDDDAKPAAVNPFEDSKPAVGNPQVQDIVTAPEAPVGESATVPLSFPSGETQLVAMRKRLKELVKKQWDFNGGHEPSVDQEMKKAIEDARGGRKNVGPAAFTEEESDRLFAEHYAKIAPPKPLTLENVLFKYDLEPKDLALIPNVESNPVPSPEFQKILEQPKHMYSEAAMEIAALSEKAPLSVEENDLIENWFKYYNNWIAYQTGRKDKTFPAVFAAFRLENDKKVEGIYAARKMSFTQRSPYLRHAYGNRQAYASGLFSRGELERFRGLELTHDEKFVVSAWSHLRYALENGKTKVDSLYENNIFKEAVKIYKSKGLEFPFPENSFYALGMWHGPTHFDGFMSHLF